MYPQDVQTYTYNFTGNESATLLVSTDAKVTKSDLDGTNSQPISTSGDVVLATKESNGSLLLL